MLCLLRWTRGDVGAEAGIKVCLAIVLGVVVVVVAYKRTVVDAVGDDGLSPNGLSEIISLARGTLRARRTRRRGKGRARCPARRAETQRT